MCALQEKLCGAGLRPTQTLWFEQPPVGESKPDRLKTRHHCSSLSSPCFSPSSLSNSRTDDPEAGPLDSHINIGWDKPSRRIQNFVRAVTSQNQQHNDAFNLNAEPGDRWWQKGFLREVMQTAACSGDSQSNTLERNKGSKKHVETHVETRQRHSLLNQHKASISNRVSISNWTGNRSERSNKAKSFVCDLSCWFKF